MMFIRYVVAIISIFFSTQSNAWYFTAPEGKGYSETCVWVNDNDTGVVKSFSVDNGCESNHATVKGVRWFKKKGQTCLETTGKKVTLKVSNRGTMKYAVKKKVSTCYQ
jgi:hypothetical protein